MKVMHMRQPIQPYQALFPAGIALAILGTAIWVLFGFGQHIAYPGLQHADIMVGGFLVTVATGFLMTAIPRFTGTASASRAELATALLVVALLAATALPLNRAWFHGASLAGLLLLARFLVTRFARRSYGPPPQFTFVGVGLLAGILGATSMLGLDLGVTGGFPPLRLARDLYYQGMMLGLILGVGGKLIPALLGSQSPQIVRITASAPRADRSSPLARQVALALAFAASFALELLADPRPALLARAAVASWVAFADWKLHRLPRAPGKLARWLWVSCWCLVLGLWAQGVAPAWAVHFAHLEFIGGFGLMTLMIATRVTLAHGGYGDRLEIRSKTLTATGILGLTAAATRVIAPLIPQAYLHHLAYAAIGWTLALLAWGSVFLSKTIAPSGEAAPH